MEGCISQYIIVLLHPDALSYRKPTSSSKTTSSSTSKSTSASKSSRPSSRRQSDHKSSHRSPRSFRSHRRPPPSRFSSRDHPYRRREPGYPRSPERLSDYQRSERYTEPFGDNEWYYGATADTWLFQHSDDQVPEDRQYNESGDLGEETYYDTEGYHGEDRGFDAERYDGEDEDYDDDYQWDGQDRDRYDDDDNPEMYVGEERADYVYGDDQRGYDAGHQDEFGFSTEEGYNEERYYDEEWPYDEERPVDEGHYDYADDWFGDEMDYESQGGAIDPLF